MNRPATQPVSVLAVFAVILALTSCGGGNEIAPPTIHFGQDICQHCKMIISDERFAAACVVEQKDSHYEALAFDDIGCLLEYEQRHLDKVIVARFVKDFATRDWLDIEQAFFVYSASIHSPMASGVAACRTEQEAIGLVDRFVGQVMRLDELRTRAHTGTLRIDAGAHQNK